MQLAGTWGPRATASEAGSFSSPDELQLIAATGIGRAWRRNPRFGGSGENLPETLFAFPSPASVFPLRVSPNYYPRFARSGPHRFAPQINVSVTRVLCTTVSSEARPGVWGEPQGKKREKKKEPRKKPLCRSTPLHPTPLCIPLRSQPPKTKEMGRILTGQAR